jgi:hypothetical protein
MLDVDAEAAVRQVVKLCWTIPDTPPATGEYCSASLLHLNN